MLKLSITFKTTTPESAEDGDTAETGFLAELEEFSAHELAVLIKRDGFTQKSDSHGLPRWLTAHGDPDMRTGIVENRSIHPGEDKQSQRVWAQVLRICGVV